MVTCRYCDEDVEDEEAGARCPRCHEPLHDRPGGPRPASTLDYDDERGLCAAHPENVAVGTCHHCGNFICSVCRTRWYGSNLCLLCLDRTLQAREANPEESRAHRRQAAWSLWLGLGAWAGVGFGLLMLLALMTAGSGGSRGARRDQDAAQDAAQAAGLAIMAFLTSVGLAVFGVGQGAAAVRSRGDRMVLAVCGLVLNASCLGVLLGVMLMALVRQ